ncbi:MAG: hypothetical protein JWO79_2646 [Actinomycetia bacterium]|nr:hypothetical protein [Actinomycetes bacterium]
MRIDLPASFFTTHWRREPALLPGLGSSLLSTDELGYRSLRDLVTAHPDSRGDRRTIWFLERLRDSPEWARELASTAGDLFEWDDIWCDLFVTAGPSSIGRHFDDSDNFTIQLAGTKTWRLKAPTSIPAEWRRRRALGEPGVGGLAGAANADDLVYQVGPGDVLYIPSMWQHEGRSDGDSASVSLVVNISTMLHALYPALEYWLRRCATWSDLIEVGPGSAGRRAGQLTGALVSETFAGLRDALLVEAGTYSVRRRHSPRQAPPPVILDTAHLREYVASAPQVPENDVVLLDPRSAGAFAGLVARRNARRLARLLVTRSGETTDSRPRALYSAVAELLGTMDPEQADHSLTDPDVTSWIAAAEATGRERLPRPRTEDPDADVLAMALLPELLELDHGQPLVIRPRRDIDGGLTLRRLGLRIGPEEMGTADPQLVICGNELTYHDRSGSRTLSGGVDAAPPFDRLDWIHGGGAVICGSASLWFAEQAAPGAGVYSASPGELTELNDVLNAAVALLDRCYPAAAATHRTNIRTILPLPSIGHRANNYSLPNFRGLIATSAREPYMIAQALAHETAHNQMNSILEVAALCTNPTEEVISPVVNIRRPLTAVFHGCVAFCQDLHVSRGLADLVPAAAPRIERYFADRLVVVEAAIAVLKEHADLTGLGKVIVAEAERITSNAC